MTTQHMHVERRADGRRIGTVVASAGVLAENIETVHRLCTRLGYKLEIDDGAGCAPGRTRICENLGDMVVAVCGLEA